MVMETETRQRLESAGWRFPEAVWDCLSPYERSFLLTECAGTRSVDYYVRRLERIGFAGMGRVLDAGCGMGQWAVALAGLNEEVDGVDVNVGRLLVARELARAMDRPRCRFAYAGMEAPPFADGVFDGVFCYGSFMFSETRATLAGFHRVLAPGGLLYLNANGWGWWLHLLLDRSIRGADPRLGLATVRMLVRTLCGRRRDVIFGERRLVRAVRRAGFEVLGVGREGEVAHPGATGAGQAPPPAYPPRFYGRPAITEILARKPDGAGAAGGAGATSVEPPRGQTP
jgi:SAM-dependent methyltransferase